MTEPRKSLPDGSPGDRLLRFVEEVDSTPRVLAEKFRRLVGARLGAAEAERLEGLIARLDEVDRLTRLTQRGSGRKRGLAPRAAGRIGRVAASHGAGSRRSRPSATTQAAA